MTDAPRFADAWRGYGANHLCVDTRYGPVPVSLDEHCEQTSKAAAALSKGGA
jgi:hypothetical protein